MRSLLIAQSGNNGQTRLEVQRRLSSMQIAIMRRLTMQMTDELTFAIAEAQRQAWVAAQAPANRALADNVTKLFLFQPPW